MLTLSSRWLQVPTSHSKARLTFRSEELLVPRISQYKPSSMSVLFASKLDSSPEYLCWLGLHFRIVATQLLRPCDQLCRGCEKRDHVCVSGKVRTRRHSHALGEAPRQSKVRQPTLSSPNRKFMFYQSESIHNSACLVHVFEMPKESQYASTDPQRPEEKKREYISYRVNPT